MDKKKIIWTIVSAVIAVLTVVTIISFSKEFSPKEFLQFIRRSEPGYMIGALLCMFGYVWFEGVAIIRLLTALGYVRPVYKGILYAGADVYFSAITPSASGGQPACAYFMLKDGVPGATITVVLLVNLMMHTVALLVQGLFSIFFRFPMLMQYSLVSIILVCSGIVVLMALTTGYYLLLRKEKVLYGICDRVLAFLERIHLMKTASQKREKLMATMKDYRACADALSQSPGMLWENFFWNMLQRLSLIFISFMAILAQGYPMGRAIDVMVNQCYVSLGSYCVPIPGGMGVADYIMLDGLAVIAGDAATNLELLCRGISFYGCILMSGIFVAAGLLVRRRKARE